MLESIGAARAVSKDTLVVAFLTNPDTWKVSSFANSPDGIRHLKNALPSEAHVVIEATGSYSVLLTYLLCQAKICLSVINPKQSHHFGKMQPHRFLWVMQGLVHNFCHISHPGAQRRRRDG